MNLASPYEKLAPYLTDKFVPRWLEGNLLADCISRETPGLTANRHYFDQLDWVEDYCQSCHRDPAFYYRWQAATGQWHNQIVVDVGCGPGNLNATLGNSPALLGGVDISANSLRLARQFGYLPILADAQQMPFVSDFADLVTLNATLHHCDDMSQTLAEAARLVRPGGLLVVDHDPQCSAYAFKGLGLLLWQLRLPIYRLMGYTTSERQKWELATEIHHVPGRGVTPELFYQTLEPLGFRVTLFPHNHSVGAEALQDKSGRAPLKCRLAQHLSGIDPNRSEAALSLMCLARRSRS